MSVQIHLPPQDQTSVTYSNASEEPVYQVFDAQGYGTLMLRNVE